MKETVKWEAEFDEHGTPERERLGTSILFFEEGWWLRIKRCPKGRYLTDWVIKDVSPRNRHSECDGNIAFMLRGGVGWVEDDYQGV